MSNMLKVGDTVNWKGNFGTAPSKKAKVVSIEINCKGKYGDDVDSVSWDKVNRRDVNIDLDNDSWCYGTQISKVK